MLIVALDIHKREGFELFCSDIEKALRYDYECVLIVSGDVTQSGKKEEYAKVAKWFGKLISDGNRIVLADGNHEVTKRFHIISFVKDRYKAQIFDPREKKDRWRRTT
ncbi:MAG: hypothetical protein ACTSU7_13685 [Candidatus Heimdallarchaeaceae archaeon]